MADLRPAVSAGSVQHAALAPTRITCNPTGDKPFHYSEVMRSRLLAEVSLTL